MVWLIVIAGAVLFGWLYFKFFKIPKIKNIVFVDGTLGTGKTFYSVALAVRLYRREIRWWKVLRGIGLFLKPIAPIFRKWSEMEEPLLYSNIPLRRVKHVPLTLDILLRKTRVNYRSVILMDEMSLIADQFDYKDRETSEAMRDFFKLYRHESKGGYLVINSQSTSDLHYSIKSVLSDYFYLHHKTKLPFFVILSAQEMAYSSDKDAHSVVNANNADVEENLKKFLVSKKYYKYYDTYCYSVLTDSLPVEDNYIVLDRKDSAKAVKVLSFRRKEK